eukprot:SAG11_NODE_30137_length_303_cov_18.151961_1_plen_56_part_10
MPRYSTILGTQVQAQLQEGTQVLWPRVCDTFLRTPVPIYIFTGTRSKNIKIRSGRK